VLAVVMVSALESAMVGCARFKSSPFTLVAVVVPVRVRVVPDTPRVL
jgi:hypothetical protein